MTSLTPPAPDPAPGPADAPTGERPAPESPPRRRWHRWRWPLAAAALVLGLLVVTSFTGLPAPGPFHRYPTALLDDIAVAVHADAGDLRTPDDCWRTTYRASQDDAPDGPPRAIAAVDHLRSRVVVRAYADQRGRVDDRTAEAIERRIDQIVRDDPRFDRSMVLIEPSPDGWSPLMSCPLVIRGWL